MYHRALKIYEDKLGREREHVGEICLKLSLLHANLNHRVEAQNFANRARCIKERAAASNQKLISNNNNQQQRR